MTVNAQGLQCLYPIVLDCDCVSLTLVFLAGEVLLFSTAQSRQAGAQTATLSGDIFLCLIVGVCLFDVSYSIFRPEISCVWFLMLAVELR